ncbi:MMPL family transporter [Leuconostoc falkenbergense]|uniref:MMPL family transporter n=1 Tax=Leuconostoc falkenbergense TaxID=2766470 RepID=UPI0024AE58B4|nr:MMPL family transporter [Leuconostoc falkenbergense]MDI6666741.1 MMPL family transporter [Leuconostoc falkenbergense]
MGNLLTKLGGWIFTHAKITIGLVLSTLVILATLALQLGSNFGDTSLNLPNSQSQKAMKVMEKEFAATSSDKGSLKIVFHSQNAQKLTDSKNKQKINQLLDTLSHQKFIDSVVSPDILKSYDSSGNTAYANLVFKENAKNVTKKQIRSVTKRLKITRDANIQTEVTGNVTLNEIGTGGSSEGIGVAIAYIILTITFASLLVAGLPIISALVGLVTSMLTITVITNIMKIPAVSTSLVAMLGLAVGIDYALFIISRYRQEISQGKTRENAIKKTMSTAGVSVVFAGLTVMVAMLGMTVLGIDFVGAMGITAAIGVLLSVVIAITFVPALLVLFGNSASGKKSNRFLIKFHSLHHRGGWGNRIIKYRLLMLISSIVVLSFAAIPLLNINLGLPNNGELSTKQTERRAYDLEQEAYGKGIHSTLIVIAKTSKPENVSLVSDKIKKLANVMSVSQAMPSKTQKYYMMAITPKTDSNDIKTKKLVNQIRNISKKENTPSLLVTGPTAVSVDVVNAISNAIPKFAIIIVSFAFLLLMIIFRSILIPLVAVLGFIMSLGSTLGVVVWIIQEGNLHELFNIPSKAAILAFLPVLVIGIMFGLAMDYEIFLVSRIREVYNETKNTNQAVQTGLRENGTIVMAAIIIMACVFSGFIFATDGIIKSIGLALTTGILFDALIVRMVIVPSAISLFGKANWYFPHWLDKILPQIHLD